MDVHPPKFDQFIIKGSVVISQELGDVTIEANIIWVKGKLKAGTASSPFPHKLTIKMYGEKSDPKLVIDDFESGNKLIAVTGSLILYG